MLFVRCEIPYHTRDYVKLQDWQDGGGRRILAASGRGKTARTGKYSLLTAGHLLVAQVASYDEYTQFMCTAVNTLTGVNLVIFFLLVIESVPEN